jgi:hypothetical protein
MALASVACYTGRATVLDTLLSQSSPVDWCEANYVHSQHIAEFWNTVSSLALSFFGVWGLFVYRHDAQLHKLEPNLYLVWILIILVGLGSVWFHGSLSVAGQISDEVPIVTLILVIIMVSSGTQKHREWVLDAHVLLRSFVWFFVFCLFFPVLSHLIVIPIIPLGVFKYVKDYRNASPHPSFRTVFWTSIGTYSTATGSWILDRVACEQVTQLSTKLLGFPLQLHAVWHVCIGLTFWIVIGLFLMMRAKRERPEVQIDLKKGSFFLVEIAPDQLA